MNEKLNAPLFSDAHVNNKESDHNLTKELAVSIVHLNNESSPIPNFSAKDAILHGSTLEINMEEMNKSTNFDRIFLFHLLEDLDFSYKGVRCEIYPNTLSESGKYL